MPAIIRYVVGKHLDEAVAVGKMLLRSSRSPVMTMRDVRAWKVRFEIHLDALRTASEGLLPLVEARLLKGEPDDLFAGILAIAVIGSTAAAERINQLLVTAIEPALWIAIRDALYLVHLPDSLLPLLVKAYETGSPATSALVAEVLSGHGRLRKLPSRLPEYFRHELPVVRAAAWRILGMFNDERIKPMKSLPAR